MILYCDTRQKEKKHLNIERYCSEHKITMIPKCLSVGDYMLPNSNISVDTKQSVIELANDLYADKKALNKKYKKCYHEKIRLVVLVEEYITKDELIKWESKHTKINGRFLLDLMHDIKVSYGVKFYFCRKRDVAASLIKILKGEI